MIDAIALGKRIKGNRRAKELTQEQLGVLIGVTAQAVSRWENGDSVPDLGLMPDLCRIFDVTSDSLLGISVPCHHWSKTVSIDQALEICRRTGCISVSRLQRELRIGYRQAKVLADEVCTIEGQTTAGFSGDKSLPE